MSGARVVRSCGGYKRRRGRVFGTFATEGAFSLGVPTTPFSPFGNRTGLAFA